MTFSEYLLDRDEEMAFSILEYNLENEGLIRGLKSIWNVAKGKKYNQGDVKSAMHTSNLIANIPDAMDAGSGMLDILKHLGLSAGLLMNPSSVPPEREPTPIVQAYNPPAQPTPSYDIYRSAKGERDKILQQAQKYAKAKAFNDLDKKRFNLDFIHQTPSV